LDDAGGECAAGREEGDRLDADVEVVGDLQVDERQDDRPGVVDRVGPREQPERPLGPDVAMPCCAVEQDAAFAPGSAATRPGDLSGPIATDHGAPELTPSAVADSSWRAPRSVQGVVAPDVALL
jgi:hypothetical protein